MISITSNSCVGFSSINSGSNFFLINTKPSIRSHKLLLESTNSVNSNSNIPTEDRKDLWKSISSLEKQGLEFLMSGEDKNTEEAYKLFAKSSSLKRRDPFIQLIEAYVTASDANDLPECERLLAAMRNTGVPPHLAKLALKRADSSTTIVETEDVDLGSFFSDTVTEKIRVKISSNYDNSKSEPAIGKFMFWYKVSIFNEGPDPVQVVGRMWEIEKWTGDKEIVRGSGIMSTQPIIAPGDVFTYQSVCPLKVSPPKGRRVIGSMSGAYTMCKGNMGQHNFSVKVGKFNFILPEATAASTK